MVADGFLRPDIAADEETPMTGRGDRTMRGATTAPSTPTTPADVR